MHFRGHAHLQKLISSIFLWNQNKTTFSFPRSTTTKLSMSVLFMHMRNKETVKGEKRYLARRRDFSNWKNQKDDTQKYLRKNGITGYMVPTITFLSESIKWVDCSILFRKFCFQLYIGCIKQLIWLICWFNIYSYLLFQFSSLIGDRKGL